MGLFGGGGASSTSVSTSDEIKTMTVYVTVGDQNLQCEVRRGDTVSNLRTAVRQNNSGVSAEKMHFTYKDTPLKDDERLSKYGIKNRSRVTALFDGPQGGHGGHGHKH